MIKYMLIYIVFINLVTFFLFFIDKRYAKKGKQRISESTLFGFVFFGGGIGAFVSMKTFHHKTKKMKFLFGIPFITLVEYVLLIYFIFLR